MLIYIRVHVQFATTISLVHIIAEKYAEINRVGILPHIPLYSPCRNTSVASTKMWQCTICCPRLNLYCTKMWKCTGICGRLRNTTDATDTILEAGSPQLSVVQNDPLSFWSQHASSFQFIAELAHDLFAAPASEAFVKRIFSVCGMLRLLTQGRRNQMTRSLEIWGVHRVGHPQAGQGRAGHRIFYSLEGRARLQCQRTRPGRKMRSVHSQWGVCQWSICDSASH